MQKKQKQTPGLASISSNKGGATIQDWKSHPVVIAAGSSAATLLLCIAIVTQVIIPNQTAKLEIELLKQKDAFNQLNSKASDLTNSQKLLNQADRELRQQLVDSRESIKALRSELMIARAGSLLAASNPYPIGFGAIRVGMSIDEIYKHFPKGQIEIDDDRPGAVTVKPEDSPFDRVYYYYDADDKRRQITHMSFNLSAINDFPRDFLLNKLIESLGEPAEHPAPRYFRWRELNGVVVYMMDSSGFMVMKSIYEPALWPQKRNGSPE